MLKIRLAVPTIIRVISIITFVCAFVIAVRAIEPDRTIREKVYGNEYIETSIPNPYTYGMAAITAVSAIILFGFASIVEASDRYLLQSNLQDKEGE